jgi:hypothetical protein
LGSPNCLPAHGFARRIGRRPEAGRVAGESIDKNRRFMPVHRGGPVWTLLFSCQSFGIRYHQRRNEQATKSYKTQRRRNVLQNRALLLGWHVTATRIPRIALPRAPNPLIDGSRPIEL